MAVITVQNLSKTYEYYKKQPGLWASVAGRFKREKLYAEAVKDISFTIQKGELVGFLGPNGAGKTTTLKMLSGILYPTAGTAQVLGYNPSKRQAAYQKQFTLVMGQKNQLWWDLPPMESFILNKDIYELSDAEFKRNLDELVEVLDVKDILNVQVRKLSLGQRMKCELIAALLHKPKVLFLDEPTIGLDVVAQHTIRHFIRQYNQSEKTTILLTSHYMEDIKELCERVIIIDHGKIIYDGKLDTLIKQYAPFKLLKLTFNAPGISLADVEHLGRIDSFSPLFVTIKVERENTPSAAQKILSSNLPVTDILIDEVEVDDVIRKIFKKE